MKARGFTLIELMIVVTIIGILAAIALPAIQGKTHKTYDCRGGYRFDVRTGDQVLGAHGGGVPCSSGSSETNVVSGRVK